MQRGAASLIVDAVAVVSVTAMACMHIIEGHAALWLISTIAAVRYNAPRDGLGGIASLARAPLSLLPRSMRPRRREREHEHEPDMRREPKIRSKDDDDPY